MSFGSHLREYREHRGWSLADLSNATHYSRGHLSNIENDRKVPTADLARLCDEALRARGELIAEAERATTAPPRSAPLADGGTR
jgi:transcriptional regulator with XRE-family HTH domain